METISFTLNGSKTTYSGDPSARLLDILRTDMHLCGTKSGCKEGECGACSLLIDGQLINSCLVAMGSLHNATIVTIEGKTPHFAALDKAYSAVSAIQCGFCTPGMIMASEALLSSNPNPSPAQIREAISGNLCRCTGYNSIVRAIGLASHDIKKDKDLGGQPPNPRKLLKKFDQNFDLVGVLRGLRGDSSLVPYAGGTDLMVGALGEGVSFLFLRDVFEMRQIVRDDEFIRIGAACSFSEIIESPLVPAILCDACHKIGAPAIRNAGTIGGNIANASAKADSALVCLVADAKLRLAKAGHDGHIEERIIPIKDFYLGHKRTALTPGELIIEILIPRSVSLDNYCYTKIGARKALAISCISFAGIMEIRDGIIRHCATAFGAISDIILRFEEPDSMMIGKSILEASNIKDAYLAAYDSAIVPIRGRVSAAYRKDVCMNLLTEFLAQNGIK